jgi:hypothetical protein
MTNVMIFSGRGWVTEDNVTWTEITPPQPIPEGAMRVAPGSDAVVWRINSDRCGEL